MLVRCGLLTEMGAVIVMMLTCYTACGRDLAEHAQKFTYRYTHKNESKEALLGRFWRPSWGQVGSKIGPRGVQNSTKTTCQRRNILKRSKSELRSDFFGFMGGQVEAKLGSKSTSKLLDFVSDRILEPLGLAFGAMLGGFQGPTSVHEGCPS